MNNLTQELADKILARKEEFLQGEAKVSRQVCPRASSITECPREMYYSILNWDLKPPPEPWLMARFQEGKDQERKVLRDLQDLGFEVVAGQKPIELKDRKGRVILTGSIDGMCLWKDKRVPFEVKSLNPNIYAQIDKIDDFNKYEWAKKYPRQMTSYLFGNDFEEGLMIITDCLGHWKIFVVTLDYAEMEEILKRCEFVMDRVEAQNPPEFIQNASICRKCWAFGRVCQPPMDFGEGAQVIDDPEIEVLLNKREELKPQSMEYAQIDKQIKAYFKGRLLCICGDWEISGKEIVRKLKPQEAKEIKSWQTKIEKIN